MNEWILVMTIFLKGNIGEVRDISPIIVQGFKSDESCMAAMNVMAQEVMSQANKPRASEGYATNKRGLGMPNINANCIKIVK